MNTPSPAAERITLPRPNEALFEASDLVDLLDGASPAALDNLPLGVVALEPGGRVVAYNAFEQRLSGLDRADVLGRIFFVDVAPCTNNFMVAERFHESFRAGTPLDERLRYTFTYGMKLTRVVLRLLVRGQRGWLVVCPE